MKIFHKITRCVVKSVKRVFLFFINLPAQVNAVPMQQPASMPDDDICYILVMFFNNFIPYATKHYNAQLDMLSRNNPYRARYVYSDMLSLAANYFKRNRNRLFQWWCMNNDNVLTSDPEFRVQKDLLGFNGAFKMMCKKKLYIDVDPDTDYTHGVVVINDDGSMNMSIIRRL